MACYRFLFSSTIAIHALLTIIDVNANQVSTDSTQKFKKTEICDLDARLDSQCAEMPKGVFRSKIECAESCMKNTSCIAVSSGDNHSCYHHYDCSQEFVCDENRTKSYVYEKLPKLQPCSNGGIWDISTNMCKCPGGWIGIRCQTPHGCQILSETGSPTYPDGNHWVHIDLDPFTQPVYVRCFLHSTMANTYIMVNYGKMSHNRTWEDYVHGYFLNSEHLWVGLEKIKALTDHGYDMLYVDTYFFRDGQLNMFMNRYHGFRMSDESTGFSFTYDYSVYIEKGPMSASLEHENCFQDIQGVPFSTFDNDNDQTSQENCAALAGVGWWFTDCNMKCNPLGWTYFAKPDGLPIEHLFMAGLNFSEGSYADRYYTHMYFQTR